MGKGDLPLPHFSKQTWVCAFFITSVKSFYRDEKVVRSRAYKRFTVVKIREGQICACENGVEGLKKWDFEQRKFKGKGREIRFCCRLIQYEL